MLFIIPPKRPRARVIQLTEETAPPLLTLIGATYDPGVSVTLTFNQAIDISAVDLAAIQVTDAQFEGTNYNGLALITSTANSITVELEVIESVIGSGVTLNVSEANGIVAAGGGAAWTGADNVALPFG